MISLALHTPRQGWDLEYMVRTQCDICGFTFNTGDKYLGCKATRHPEEEDK